MVAFVDRHKEQSEVEPICKQLWIAPSSYYEHKARERDSDRLPDRIKWDRRLDLGIQRIWKVISRFMVPARYGGSCCGRNKRCSLYGRTVDEEARDVGYPAWSKMLDNDCKRFACYPTDKVNRQFVAMRPNQLWVADVTYVATWMEFAYTDVFARYIVGWRVSRSLCTDLVLDALEQALWFRKKTAGLIHHSDRGSSICRFAIQNAWRRRILTLL